MNRRIELWLKYALTIFYLWAGITSLTTGMPLGVTWLTLKALLFGLIFAAAIIINVAFKPVGAQIGRLIADGSTDATERPLLATLNRTRLWVWTVYALLLVTAFPGNVKPW